MSEFKILADNLEAIADEKILTILAYIAQHHSEKVTLLDIVGFVGISPSTLQEKYLDPLCKEGLLQKFYLRDETSTYAINKGNMDERFKIIKMILNS